MDKGITEKRQFPRVNVTFPIRITPEFLGETVDLSQGGLGFALEKPLLLSKVHAKIELSPEESIDTELKIIWNKRLIKEGRFTYGACFVRLGEKDLEMLGKVLISNQIKILIDNIEDKRIKDKVYNFFINYVREYLDRVTEINNLLIAKVIQPHEIEQKLSFLNDFVVQKGDEIEKEIDSALLIKKIKENFRKLVSYWTTKGIIVKNALEKPRGYPGDYELLEMIYNNRAVSEGIGFFYDKDFLDNDYAIGVRERKNEMKNILREFIVSCNSNKINILNLACGACREIRELFIEDNFMTEKEINFVCLDQDEQALQFSKNNLDRIPKNIQFRFLKENVINLSVKNKAKLPDLQCNFDMVYTIGLADYLPDRVLKSLLKFSYDILQSKGKLVIAHKDIERYKPLQPNWFCDWNFYFRNEENLINIMKEITKEQVYIEKRYIKRGCIFFIILTKI
ncbi:MAG: PilZ domain-containing protein [Candidatus Omnitrophica bacterium]|nr:PilZ domain-containing protein [Candidatus Omnitrophota bacterium]